MKVWVVIFAGLIVHIVFFISIFDIYFTTTLVNGMTPHVSPLPAPAKRMVFIVADGLRADKFFGLMPNGSSPAPYLRYIIEQQGAWGVSHAAVPTATRPGHVAITAGFYEDPTSVAKDLQGNAVLFDTVFNESRYTWSWDTPDFLGSVTKDNENRMFSKKYPGDMKWLAGLDAGDMDSWVFNGVHELFENSKKDEPLKEKMNQDKILFFLHLGGLDHSGYIVRPNSEAYLKHITLVDRGVKSLVEDFDRYYNHDGKTAYVFTSDHGMTDWGAHGDGTPEETLTPLVVWGPGVRRPEREHKLMNDRLSKGSPDKIAPDGLFHAWKLNTIKRTDISQASMASLLSASIGIPFPMHSIFPVPEYIFNISDHEVSEMLFANFRQLLDQYQQTRLKREQESLQFSFTPFKKLSESNAIAIVDNIKSLIKEERYTEAIKECKDKINLALDGLHYYRTYDRMYLWFSITVSYLGWMIFLVTILLEEQSSTLTDSTIRSQPSRKIRATIVCFFSVLSVVVFTVLYVQSVVWLYYLYILLPIPIWMAVTLRYNILCHIKSVVSSILPIAPYIGLTFVGLELTVFSFSSRAILSVVLFLFGLWPWLQKAHIIEKPILFQWLASCLTVAFFPLLPSADRTLNYDLVVFSGVLVIAVACLLVKGFASRVLAKRKLALIFGFQIICIAVSTIVVRHTAKMTASDMRTPLFNQITSWIILGLGIVEPFLVTTDIRCRLLSIALAWISPYILLSISHESLFVLSMCWNLYIWMVMENSLTCTDNEASVAQIRNGSTTTNTVPSKVLEKLDFASISNQLSTGKTPRQNLVRADLRRAYYFVFLVIASLFGTGNIASVNSFDPAEVFCFLTISNPLFMGILMIFKMCIPVILIGCVLRAIILLTQVPEKSFYALVMLMADVVGLHFFFLVGDTGTWFEIGKAVSHYVIYQVFNMIILVLFGATYVLTTCNIFCWRK